MTASHYLSVPTDLVENLQFRQRVLTKAAQDERTREVLLEMCKQDILFFVNCFAWTFEPRPQIVNGKQLPNQIPFIAWEHQVPAFLTIKEHLGFEDIGVEKSRGEGMSWMMILLALHDWLFDPYSKVGLVSRTELAADNPDDPDSLFWKIDWELTKLPRWMPGVNKDQFVRNLTKHTLRNTVNGAVIAAYAATGDVASGGRCKWFGKDELAKFPRPADQEAMASTQHVTNSRLIVSTPKGTSGAYYDAMHKTSSMVKIILDWKQNPTRNRGLYTLDDGKPVAVDPTNNPLTANYNPPSPEILDRFTRLRRNGFRLEGRLRSPWYDHECDRPGATPQSIAQELDRDYGGSAYRVFGEEFFLAAEKEVREPFTTGILSYTKNEEHEFTSQFQTLANGPILLWTALDAQGMPPPHRYAFGADVAGGLGGSYSSNSTLEGFDLLTNEQVFEFATKELEPPEFAEFCVAVCNWFYGAYLSWENNGSTGGSFTKRVKTLKYTNVYRDKGLMKKKHKRSNDLGWLTNPKTKGVMFGELQRSVRCGELKLHSRALVDECSQYVWHNEQITHVLAANTDDETPHGDRVIGACVGVMAMRDRPLASSALKQELTRVVHPDSMAGRNREFEDAKKSDDGWDDRSVWDLAHGRLAA